MRFEQESWPSLFDDNLVLREYTSLLDYEAMKIAKDMISIAKQNPTYVARTIWVPMLESYGKLVKYRNELKNSVRCLMFHSKTGNPHIAHYMMSVDEEMNKINLFCQICVVEKGVRHHGTLFLVDVDRADTEIPTFRSHPTVPPRGSIKVHDDIVESSIRAILSAELFINFAEVETKTMKPNEKIWDGPVAKYNNKTRSNIKVIDSTWYTTTISSGEFTVHGHWRMQPYGPGLTKKKLIWINEFKKDGYTRVAKIETNEDNN